MTSRLQAAFRRHPADPRRSQQEQRRLPEERRRRPVDWRRYSRHAGQARKKLPRRGHPLPVTLLASAVFAVAGLLVVQSVGAGVGRGLADLGRSLVSTIPQPSEAPLVLGETQVSVSAAPILEGVPEFTKANELRVEGRVPAFAVRPERIVALRVDGQPIGTLTVGTDGRFGGGTYITLPDGASTVTVALVEGAAEIASSSYTVVVDRQAPALSILRPKPGDEVEGPDVIVEGKTEAAADVTVNGRALRPNPDGTFTERLTAPPGELKLTVIARDKAGNETKAELTVKLKEGTAPSTAGVALTVTLDRAKVPPGGTVVAEVTALDRGVARADLAVTLQVGVITIGTYRTDASGKARIGFAAPDHEVEDVAVVVLGGGTSARATLTVAKPQSP